MLKIPAEKVVETVRTRDGERVAVIRTTDRGNFRHCRRKWNWSSAMKENLRPREQAGALWFGTGMHYALEDYHGERAYGGPEQAFSAYVQATSATEKEDYILPPDKDDLHALGYKMMEYYDKVWLKRREPLKTFVYKGVPQTEVNFIVEVPFPLAKFGYDQWWDKVVYAGTVDRVIIDEYDQLWIVDYKSTAQMKGSHLNNDPQVCTYTWLAAKYYDGLPIAGFIYHQFLKAVPKVPQPLKTGKISIAKNQRVSAELYRMALEKRYGSIEKCPKENYDFYFSLMDKESSEHDPFIRRSWVTRSKQAIEAEGQIIMMELEDMLNQNLPLYPNRNWMCQMCEFYEPCISLDDGSDWQEQINYFAEREKSNTRNAWKSYLPNPETFNQGILEDPVDALLRNIDENADESPIAIERSQEEMY